MILISDSMTQKTICYCNFHSDPDWRPGSAVPGFVELGLSVLRYGFVCLDWLLTGCAAGPHLYAGNS